MDSNASFERLMRQVRAGCPDAIKWLVSIYTPHVMRIVRRRLRKKLRKKFDSTDFAQSVWASFFAEALRWGDFPNPEALGEFLVKVARNKTLDEVRRRYHTQRYDIALEESLRESHALRLVKPQPAPTPSQVAVRNEAWDGLREITTAQGFPVLEMRAEGMKFEEVAERLGIDERSARRVIRRARRQLQRRRRE
jgi:RNA polymerase sigma factor (sigma-70 family)